jgi:cytoplasmic iron level regulating protein YaaA (DUF328/UPF0246 family)
MMFMSLSDKLAAKTHEKFSLWGKPGQSKTPALFGFTGLIFKHLDASSLSKNVVVHAKKARGAIVRYAIENRAEKPKDLMGFSLMGWKAADPPPDKGSWLFTRPVE